MEYINTWQSIINGFDFTPLLDILLSILPAMVCITFHEMCHGLTAYALGDDTAKRAGRLTLNPIRHIDLYGLVMLAVFHIGWAKPVPVNMYRFKNPKRGMAVTALAGPVSNVLLTVVVMFLFGFTYYPLLGLNYGHYVIYVIRTTAYMSIGLAVFNLLPIPPLDGSKVLFSVIPSELYEKLMRYERYGMLLLIVLVFTGVLGNPLSSLISWCYGKFTPIAQFGLSCYYKLFL